MASLMVMSEASSQLRGPVQRSAVRPIAGVRRTGQSAPAGVDFDSSDDSDDDDDDDERKTHHGSLGWYFSSKPPTASGCDLESNVVVAAAAVAAATGNGSKAVDSPGGRPSSARSPKRNGLTKKVSFADDIGEILTQIRVFTESSDTPPNLSPRILRRHASDDTSAAAAPAVPTLAAPKRHHSLPILSRYFRPMSSPSAGATAAAASAAATQPPQPHYYVSKLMPNFAMPVADRALYLDTIDRKLVCLESVGAMCDVPATTAATRCARCGASDASTTQRLVGSVGVKNVAFEKTVIVRCSFDGWLTSVDVRAVYARSERSDPATSVASPAKRPPSPPSLSFDVFEFSVNVPPTAPRRFAGRAGGRLCAELAVFYDVNGDRHWDNNNGMNYELIGTVESCGSASSSRFRDTLNTTEAAVFGPSSGAGGSRCWSEFSGWSSIDSTCPYW